MNVHQAKKARHNERKNRYIKVTPPKPKAKPRRLFGTVCYTQLTPAWQRSIAAVCNDLF